jgi:RNA polymerase sigma factor (TIGR02999 family)
MTDAGQVTLMLHEVADGNVRAADQLLPLVYDELRALASRNLGRERSGHTLQATALVHEAYLHLVDQTRASFRDRQHFFAVAATAMRRILVDHARTHGRLKRGAGLQRQQLDLVVENMTTSGVDPEGLNEALNKLSQVDARKARLVELRFFGGLTIEEAAQVLEIAPATAKRDWLVAKGFIYREMTGETPPNGEVEQNRGDR